MSVPHALHDGAQRQGLTLLLAGGPQTVLDHHPNFARLVSAVAHPAATPDFLARLVEAPQLAGTTR